MTKRDVERVVLTVLTAIPSSSAHDVILRVKEKDHISDAEARDALWRLLDRDEVRLTRDLKLQEARR